MWIMSRSNILLIFPCALYLLSFVGALTDDEVASIDRIQWTKLPLAYQAFNDFLVENVDNTDVETNLDFAKKALDSRLKEGVNREDPFMIALKLFASLKEVASGDHKCSQNSTTILKYNTNLLLGGRRRVDVIAKEVALRHANECEGIYLKVFDEKFQHLNKTKLDLNTAVFDLSEIAGSDQARTSLSIYTAIQDFSLVSKCLRPDDILSKLKSVAKDDPDRIYLSPVNDEFSGKKEIVEEKFRELYEKYIVEPCNYLTKELDNDIFRPARYDSRYMHEVDPTRPQFYLVWARLILCDYSLQDMHLFGSSYDLLKAHVSLECSSHE